MYVYIYVCMYECMYIYIYDESADALGADGAEEGCTRVRPAAELCGDESEEEEWRRRRSKLAELASTGLFDR
jgi:hypothetical protein